MTISIEYASPRHPEIRNLLLASHDLMGSLFPAEANHFLSIDAFCYATIHFFGVRVDGVYRACGFMELIFLQKQSFQINLIYNLQVDTTNTLKLGNLLLLQEQLLFTSQAIDIV